MVPVQLVQRVHKAGMGKLCLAGVVVVGHLGRIRPQVHAPPRVPEGQGLLAGRHVEAHEQLAPRVHVEDVCHVGEPRGLTELTLAWWWEEKWINGFSFAKQHL